MNSGTDSLCHQFPVGGNERFPAPGFHKDFEEFHNLAPHATASASCAVGLNTRGAACVSPRGKKVHASGE